MRKLTALTSTLLLLILAIRPAAGCSCIPPPPPRKALADAVAVFSGKVLKVDKTKPRLYSVTFEVVRIYKGVKTAKVDVATATSSAACGYNFAVGQSYLVYCYGKKGLATNICTRTTSLKSAKKDLDALGKGKVPPKK